MNSKVQRWDWESKKYKPYSLNPDWTIVMVTNDMNLPVNCANCGKELPFGDTYTSLEIHTKVGFGLPVCSECFDEEAERKDEHRKRPKFI